MKAGRNLNHIRTQVGSSHLVFDDPNAITFQDRDVEGEQRWQIIGRAEAAIISVAHTFIDVRGDEVIRIISARKATRSERRAYEEEVN